MKIIAIIPARSGSKGLPDKNISDIFGHPLISYTIRCALRSNLLDRVVLSTDSSEYADIGKCYGASVPFLRPSSLSLDTTTTESTLQHSLNLAEHHFDETFDICVFLSPTDFFRTSFMIDSVVQSLIDDPTLESSFTSNKSTKNYWSFSEDSTSRLEPWMHQYSSRQTRKFVLREDTGRACASRASLWRDGKRIGDNVKHYITSGTEFEIDIHTSHDLLLLKSTLEFFKINDPSSFLSYTHGLL